MRHFETNHRPDITTVDLSQRDFKSLRRVKPEEVGKIPACLTVLKDGVLFVYRRALGEIKQAPRPNNTNGNGAVKQTAGVVQHEIGPTMHTAIRVNSTEGQPWARRSLSAGKPMGPGRHSHRNVGR